MLFALAIIFMQFALIVALGVALFGSLHFYSSATARRYSGETFFERTPGGGYRMGRKTSSYRESRPVKVAAHRNDGRPVAEYTRNKPKPTGRGKRK